MKRACVLSGFNIGLTCAAFQFLLLVVYLTLNILSVGSGGVGLPLLILFLMASSASVALSLSRFKFGLPAHFFVFLIFVAWVAYRVLVDLKNVEHLKQITIATTSGILLFFLVGTFARDALDKNCSLGTGWLKAQLVVFLIVGCLVFVNFKSRLASGTDLFYIDGVNGEYQRSGNFMIVLFLMCSLVFLNLSARLGSERYFSFLLWMFVYMLVVGFNLVNSQAMGSNAATVCILAIYLMVAVLSLLSFNAGVRGGYFSGGDILPWSAFLVRKVLIYSVPVLLLSVVVLYVCVEITGFDLHKTRIFGYGSGVNTSVSSRVEIFQDSGVRQLSMAPVLGNADVARITTGDEGRTLHSFVFNIVAELGLVGLSLAVLLFVLISNELVGVMRFSTRNEEGFVLASTSLGLFFILLFLLLYAALAVGKEWLVMWFFLGLSVNVFSFKPRVAGLNTLKFSI